VIDTATDYEGRNRTRFNGPSTRNPKALANSRLVGGEQRPVSPIRKIAMFCTGGSLREINKTNLIGQGVGTWSHTSRADSSKILEVVARKSKQLGKGD